MYGVDTCEIKDDVLFTSKVVKKWLIIDMPWRVRKTQVIGRFSTILNFHYN